MGAERQAVLQAYRSFAKNEPQRQAIVQAYRSLYRKALHAVQYSSPARHVIKATLEKAFRGGRVSDYNATRVGNTILFLDNAAKYAGIEHRILKNLLIVRWWEWKNE